jgi:hypothetical protein
VDADGVWNGARRRVKEDFGTERMESADRMFRFLDDDEEGEQSGAGNLHMCVTRCTGRL